MQKVIRVCDLHEDTVAAVSKLDYTIDGVRTVVDLCADHLAAARNSLAHLTPASTNRRAPGQPLHGSRRDLSARREVVRAWARENGYEIADKGRVPIDVVRAYLDANEDATASA